MSDATSLTDAELLALVLRGGRRSRQVLARSLIRRSGGLRAVLDCPEPELLACAGLGHANVTVLRALPELGRRYFEASLAAGAAIRSPAETETFLKARIGHLGHELFCCIFLDNRHRVLRFDEMFRGTIDGTSVYPREIVKEALAVNAAAVIVAHNHPSGVAEPSRADERITRRIRAALELVDIRLLDHLIVSAGETTSLAARGLL